MSWTSRQPSWLGPGTTEVNILSFYICILYVLNSG